MLAPRAGFCCCGNGTWLCASLVLRLAAVRRCASVTPVLFLVGLRPLRLRATPLTHAFAPAAASVSGKENERVVFVQCVVCCAPVSVSVLYALCVLYVVCAVCLRLYHQPTASVGRDTLWVNQGPNPRAR